MVGHPSEKFCFSSATAISERKSYRAEGKQLFELFFLKPAASIKASLCAAYLFNCAHFREKSIPSRDFVAWAETSRCFSVACVLDGLVPMRVEFDAVFHETWIDIRDGWVRGTSTGRQNSDY